ncbi:RNA pyrophosphohydrolase [Stakelama saccharophila]|uniref:RNA pyrophosphohydrolase n=1 Tax=Stakelama saccharophila TaxID=3075605 RepID=A0ABZ0B898_9SPHN|nr:RNA pyrophosphohydrolase [Stakelama sp. W311]WNO52826.1 RNA pyrophosphohydrolase [Stakelama sp. W311]
MNDHNAHLPYRPCAGIVLVNREGKVFVGQRLDSTLEAWQMPQGGIDKGEAPEAAALRELMEETGVTPDKVALVATAEEELYYDLPDDLIGKIWGGRYRGQRQRWFLYRFLGEDHDIDIRTPHPEFRAWRWAEPQEVPHAIVGFKKALYERIFEIFADPLSRLPTG